MRENGPDIYSFTIKVDYYDQSEFVSADVKNDEFADLVDSSEGLLKLREIFEIICTTNCEPVS